MKGDYISIPAARARLRELAVEHSLPELEDLARRMYRRQHKPRVAHAEHRKITPELQAEIRAYAAAHPDESCISVGRVFNVNPGRVSEALIK